MEDGSCGDRQRKRRYIVSVWALHRERLMEHFLGGQASGDHRVSRMSCTTRDNRIPILPLRIAS